jgi:cytoskeletal protein CcmA (bactofilin family)
MFKQKESEQEVVSHLGEGTEFTGELTFARGLRVDGIVKGKVNSEAVLIVGPKGRVEAEVNIRRISINGEFRGSIQATDRVEIHKDGKVFGDIFTPCLIIEAGAHFEGRCEMNEHRRQDGETGVKEIGVRERSFHATGSDKPWLK